MPHLLQRPEDALPLPQLLDAEGDLVPRTLGDVLRGQGGTRQGRTGGVPSSRGGWDTARGRGGTTGDTVSPATRGDAPSASSSPRTSFGRRAPRTCAAAGSSARRGHLWEGVTRGWVSSDRSPHPPLSPRPPTGAPSPTFHATAVLLEGVAAASRLLRLLAARGGHAALGREGRVVPEGGAGGDGDSGLVRPPPRPLVTPSLGTAGHQREGALQRAGVQLAGQSCGEGRGVRGAPGPPQRPCPAPQVLCAPCGHPHPSMSPRDPLPKHPGPLRTPPWPLNVHPGPFSPPAPPLSPIPASNAPPDPLPSPLIPSSPIPIPPIPYCPLPVPPRPLPGPLIPSSPIPVPFSPTPPVPTPSVPSSPIPVPSLTPSVPPQTPSQTLCPLQPLCHPLNPPQPLMSPPRSLLIPLVRPPTPPYP